MSEEDKEKTQEEVKTFLKKIKEFLDKHPEIIYIIAAAGIVEGLMLFCNAVGIAVVVTGAGAIVAGGGLAYLLKNKEHRERLKEWGKAGAGSALGAGILAAGCLFNEEKLEKFVKGISKADYPDWYKAARGLFGLNESETSKS